MWAYNSIFYQIYPIGFCNAPTHNDGQCVPRIRCLASWADYLRDLGVDAVLLNPVFESDNHGYDTRDFRKIDCRLGTNDDFSDVCKTLHEHGVKIVLDGVFNHVGRGFWAFRDVQEKKMCIRDSGRVCKTRSMSVDSISYWDWQLSRMASLMLWTVHIFIPFLS